MTNKIAIGQKVFLQITIAVLLGMVVFNVFSFKLFSQVIQGLVHREAENRLLSARGAIQVSYSEILERQRDLASHIHARFAKRIRFDQKKSREEVIHRVNRKKVTVDVPSLLIDGTTDKKHQLVDQIAEETLNDIAIFSLVPEGLVRVSTSIKNKGGIRDTPELIPPDSPIYGAIVQGRPFQGQVYVFDGWYMAAYHPILQDGRPLGALAVASRGIPSRQIKEYLRTQKLFETGYFFILDSNGSLILHPTDEGKTLAAAAANGRPIMQEILEKKSGWISYRWMNKTTNELQEKVAVFEHFPEMNWIVVASFNRAEMNSFARFSEYRSLARLLSRIYGAF